MIDGQKTAGAPLRFQRPALPSTAAIDRYLALSYEERWFSNEGPCWRLLSERLGEVVGAYCVPVASGTLGLMAAFAAIFDSPAARAKSSTVLLPSFTFLASAQATVWAGLRARLLDVDSIHWHLDPEVLEHEIRRHGADVGPVLAVSTFGTPAPAETRYRWERACRSADIPLIVDSAAAFGAVADDGVHVGAQGDLEVVSFHATKPFAIGEGGAVFTRSHALYERVKMIVNFGLATDRTARMTWGLNAKMSDLHAAAALAVLDDYEVVLRARRRFATEIRDRADESIIWQEGCERSTWQFVPVAFPDADRRAEVMRQCEGLVETRRYYEPLHMMLPFSHLPIGEKGVSRTEDVYSRVLCLPMANDLSQAELDRIVAVLRSPSCKLADQQVYGLDLA